MNEVFRDSKKFGYLAKLTSLFEISCIFVLAALAGQSLSWLALFLAVIVKVAVIFGLFWQEFDDNAGKEICS